ERPRCPPVLVAREGDGQRVLREHERDHRRADVLAHPRGGAAHPRPPSFPYGAEDVAHHRQREQDEHEVRHRDRYVDPWTVVLEAQAELDERGDEKWAEEDALPDEIARVETAAHRGVV